MMHENFKIFDEKFNVNNNLITNSDHWRLSLRPTQPTLGSCIVSLNRYCEHFSEITQPEATDLQTIITFTESRLKAAFAYDKINYLMLMMVDAHLHFHVIPRYKSEITFNGINWRDKNWPTPPDLGGEVVSDEIAVAIMNKIKG